MSDRTNPDHEWTGDDNAASNNDVAAAVAHLKAWFARELAALGLSKPTAPEPPEAPTSGSTDV